MTTELVVGAHTAVLIDRSDGRRPRTAGVIPLDGCTLDIVSYRRCIDAYVHDSAGRTMVILSADSIRAQTDITVTAAINPRTKILLEQRVRKLTPRECWRLMDRTDREYDLARSAEVGGRPMSDTAMYRLAGNSIVVAVLESIFESMFCPRSIQALLPEVS